MADKEETDVSLPDSAGSEEESNPDVAQTCGCLHTRKCQYGPAILKVGVVFIMIALVVPAGLKMWLGVSLFTECDKGTTNVSQENSMSLLPIVPAGPHDVFSKILFLIHVITSLLEVLPLAALSYKGYRYYKSENTSATIANKKCLVSFSVIASTAFSLFAFAVSVLEAWANVQFVHDCGGSTSKAVVSAILSFVFRIAGVVTTGGMIYSSLLIHKRYNQTIKCTESQVEDYGKIAKEANPIFIYQSWYFFTWILHIVLAVSTLAVILRDVVVSGQSLQFSRNYTKVEHSFLIFLAIFSLLSFGIPYVLVLSVNQWHKKAYETITEDTGFPLRKEEKLDFIPQFYTITIPTDSLQNFMPLLFPVLSLIWGLTVKISM